VSSSNGASDRGLTLFSAVLDSLAREIGGAALGGLEAEIMLVLVSTPDSDIAL